MLIATAPPPNFKDLTKPEVLETLQLAQRRIKQDESAYVCYAINAAHLLLNHERRWEDGDVSYSSLRGWVAELIHPFDTADTWLIAYNSAISANDMKRWRTQWLTHLIAYVAQHPQRYFKTSLPPP